MSERAFTLHPHPALAAPPFSLSGTATRDARRLVVHYELRGDNRQLRLPLPTRPAPADGLWQHTCLELFIAGGNGEAYREFNFAPSGEWASYAFAAYRARDAAPPRVQPVQDWQFDDGALRLRIQLSARDLPAGDWRLGIAAVLEDQSGGLSYWALQHPSPRPDFHHRDGFILTLTE
ncbi:MAG TPA: DOMON-like domain-containing protein [Azospira sp.]|nr:DOMON-like domain-containing protein [Azospira sp.]